MRRLLVVAAASCALALGGFMFVLAFGSVWAFKTDPAGALIVGSASLFLAALVSGTLERYLGVGYPWLFPSLYSAPPLLFGAGALADPTAGLFWVFFGVASMALGFVGARFAHRHRSSSENAL